MDLTHGVEPDEIRHADPYGVDLAGNQHRLERRERPARAELERIGFCGHRLAIGCGRAVDSRHGDMAHGQERLKVKIGDETAADQTDAQRWNGRATVHEVLHLAGVIGLHCSHAPKWVSRGSELVGPSRQPAGCPCVQCPRLYEKIAVAWGTIVRRLFVWRRESLSLERYHVRHCRPDRLARGDVG
jgi:hypothetical protein